MMTAFIKQMKSKLEEEKKRLEQQIAQLAGGEKHESGQNNIKWTEIGSKDDENAAEVTTYEEKLSLSKNLDKALEEVDAALKKIHEGTYGICAICGNKIPEDRLEAFPAATQHTDCSSG